MITALGGQNSGPLQCPKCGCALIGLPPEHACPECGQAYDPHMRVIRLRRHSSVYLLMGVCGLIIVSMLGGVGAGRSADAWLLGLLVLLMLAAAWQVLAERRHSGVLIINRQGIQFDQPRITGRLISWSEFGHAEYSWISGRFRIRDPSGWTVFECRYNDLGTARVARACAKEMNRLHGAYAAGAC